MPDVYIGIANAPTEVQSVLADAMENRVTDAILAELRRPTLEALACAGPGARLLDIGCGPGGVTAELLAATGVAEVVGIDPSPVMVERASARFTDALGLTFRTGDALALPFEDESFDGALFHTVLCHVPKAALALKEASRVLRPGGRLAVFDGDYATSSVAIGPNDPVQLMMVNAIHQLVHDPYFCRKLDALMRETGFDLIAHVPCPYLDQKEPINCLNLIDRGAFFLVRDGLISEDAAERITSLARARVAEGRFYGFILYHSVIAAKPGGAE